MSYCAPERPNSLIENYTASWGEIFEIWRCYNEGPSGYDPVYYEKTHSETSYGATVQQVRTWIETNLHPGYSNVTITIIGQGTTEPAAGHYPTNWAIGGTLHVSAQAYTGWKYVKMRRNGVDWTTANPGEFLNLQSTDLIEVVFVEETTPPPPNWLPLLFVVSIIGGVGVIYWLIR